MEKKKWGVHITHCCALHGCKYGDEDCPVKNGEAKQEYLCEYCSEDGFKKVEDISDLQQLKQEVERAKTKETEEISVSVRLLDILLSR